MILKKLPRIVWVTSLFLVLIITLILVIHYKVNYEYLNYNYLYFYECNSTLCMSNTKVKDNLIYSKYECGYDACPSFIKSLKEDYVILKKDKEFILYNYRTSTKISSDYEDYEFINSNYIIITSNKKKGIIDKNNTKVVDVIYEDIGYKNEEYLLGYNLNNIIVKKDNLYGIISFKDGSIIEEIKYQTLEEVNSLLVS